MSKAKKPNKPRDATPKPPEKRIDAVAPPPSHAMRETVESIVIAFVLAFLFRTFEAEAFVIPTGSMAPTLMGLHKDVDCPMCGHRYRVSASEEGEEDPEQLRQLGPRQREIVGGLCPMCRYAMPMRPDLEPIVLANRPAAIRLQRSYGGDRILVNKYLYTLTDPERWDVIVFHYPGNSEQNYIKRLVGLPGETLRIFQGDLFVGGPNAAGPADFSIARKPPDKVLAVRQLVHDTDFDPAELFAAEWPLRWVDPQHAWKMDQPQLDGGIVRQRYSVDATGGGEAWLRYNHFAPDEQVWNELDRLRAANPAGGAKLAADFPHADRRQLIMDFNAYNTRVTRDQAAKNQQLRLPPLSPSSERHGIHWVGDLMLEANVQVEAAQGELLLDLVEGGKHFTCRIELATGRATLGSEGQADFAPSAPTPVSEPGKYRLLFGNVDDQLLLWIDGDWIQFDGSTTYDADAVFGGREQIVPRTSPADPGDLAPAAIGARGAKLAVSRLAVWRDIYYIAAHWKESTQPIADLDPAALRLDLARRPEHWDQFSRRRAVEFRLGEDQFFVIGDNSPESSDARLWLAEDGRPGRPGGAYLEREMLIGKAVCVYWPHAWYTIPGTRIPIWPNFRDMRLVR